MPKGNLFEEAVSEVADWLQRMPGEIVPQLMGGKTPPWTRELKGRQLLDFYRDAPIEQKQKLWGALSPEEQQMLKDGYQVGVVGQ